MKFNNFWEFFVYIFRCFDPNRTPAYMYNDNDYDNDYNNDYNHDYDNDYNNDNNDNDDKNELENSKLINDEPPKQLISRQ
jgi:hypothetical protein